MRAAFGEAIAVVVLAAGLSGCFLSHERTDDSDGSSPDGVDIGGSQTEASEGGAGSTGGTSPFWGTSGADGARTDRPANPTAPEGNPGCGSKYDPDLICEEDATVCTFFVYLGGSTCLDYCEARGGECLAAWSDSSHGCEVEEPRDCDNPVSDQICTCTLTEAD